MKVKKKFKVWYFKSNGAMAHYEPNTIDTWASPPIKREDKYDERDPLDFKVSLKILKVQSRRASSVVILQSINNPAHTYPMFSDDFNLCVDKFVNGVITGDFGFSKHSSSYGIYYIQ